MLDMGFREDIEFILKKFLSKDKYSLFCDHASSYFKFDEEVSEQPEFIKMVHKVDSSQHEQIYYEVKRTKPDILSRLIDLYNLRYHWCFVIQNA